MTPLVKCCAITDLRSVTNLSKLPVLQKHRATYKQNYLHTNTFTSSFIWSIARSQADCRRNPNTQVPQ